jgi:hypothetical protein
MFDLREEKLFVLLATGDRTQCCLNCDTPCIQSNLVYCNQRFAKVSEVIITLVIANNHVPRLSLS